jgi:hypothetical protein
MAAPLDDFVAAAKDQHGEPGEKAARFLIASMPEADKTSLEPAFLLNHLDLAFKARAEFPWGKSVPEEIFLNDVLPYAVFDETREPWRAEFLELARPIVKDARTASEAAQALNREFFKQIKVHYHTGRKRPNQSPAESIALGKASCTGLSILLVNACRAVGIPARAVGIPLWTDKSGNHTWVEIWDDGWHFTGADEYNPKGLNHGWFVNNAAKAKPGEPLHQIYATSWQRGPLAFPLVWAPASTSVAAVDVTSRYAKAGTADSPPQLGVRLFDKAGGTRLVARVTLIDASGRPLADGETKAGTADLNDVPRLTLKPGMTGWLRFSQAGELREMPLPADLNGNNQPIIDAVWENLDKVPDAIIRTEAWIAKPAADRKPEDLPDGLSKADAERIASLLAADRLAKVAGELKTEFENKTLVWGDKSMRWLQKTFGEAPPDGRSLWISMHGGGGAPPRINDQQWQNQIRLYQPAEGIYIAPRAPTNEWNLWHQEHIDSMFQRLIEGFVALRGVNPDKVYLMGYSAGGDGVWQLAPRMADRFAAASMMAGHPNESSLLGLRNLPFAMFMGANDAAHNRNTVAAAKAAELSSLAGADPGAYVHLTRIYDGLGHWMNLKDAEAVPWMAKFKRNSWPRKIIWFQDDVTHDRFYWLKIPDKNAVKAGHQITASIDGRNIRIDGELPPGSSLWLSDHLLDLDQELNVSVNGKDVFTGKVKRSAAAIARSLEGRADLPACATAILEIP